VLLDSDPTLEGPAELEGGVRQSRLKLVLVATDLAMAGAAWTLWSLLVDVAPGGVLQGRLRLAVVATALTVAAGERLYRRSLLQTGGRVSLRRAWRAED